jgi:MFS family permease
VGGFLIDRVFGIRFGTILFLSILTIGQFIFAVGVTMNEFWLMLVGRFILGIGGENVIVAGCQYAVRWFFGKELSMAFGVQSCFFRIGSTSVFMIVDPIYQKFKESFEGPYVVGAVSFSALLTCFFSLMCAALLGKYEISQI